ncbi:unnamed protein product [Linum tenue]|uniref:Uncharacterized protein n=1 Tax=Linum tenue TaxID=586396 RepID=A0AAV0L4W5_9ROSI|nr:unnamed protein product [Linum tenue]CAI0428091.1 unnamed protein product [Linum tenue]
MGFEENDAGVSPSQSLNGSFRMTRSGLSQYDLHSSPSLDGSFRMPGSVMSGRSLSDLSTATKQVSTSRRHSKSLKDWARSLTSLDLFTHRFENWVSENDESFSSPFSIDEVLNLDLALEGVPFQQLCRMPSSSSYPSGTTEGQYLAMEDFLHAVMNGLWRTFWHRSSKPLPFSLACPRRIGSKFYTLEKVASRGRLQEVQGLAIVSNVETRHQWDRVVQFALVRPNILSENELKLSTRIICEALFFGVHILCTAGRNSVFVLVCDSTFGGVVKIEGDIWKLELNSISDPYECVIDWIKRHAEVRVSPVDQVWNKLGNANWGDIGTLQVMLATFYSMVEMNGSPKKSIATLASQHGLRLQNRRMERRIIRNGSTPHEGEIIEARNHLQEPNKKQASRLKLQPGTLLTIDDQLDGRRKSFQIQECSVGGNSFLSSAIDLACPSQLLALSVGAHTSRLEPSWEDMSLWYQVQRQTKVLNILKGSSSSSKCLPEMVACGRLFHSGQCTRQSPSGRCNDPFCGTPILVTCPVGQPLSFIVARDGPLSSTEAIRCCRDCLAGLKSAAAANVQHADICPENIVRRILPHSTTTTSSSYVLTSWGRAVLEERDSAAINLQFSSSYALQHGKLCPSSDAESLIYLLLFITGSSIMHQQQHDSIESALAWRERSWGKRLIQQQLGEVSPILKAFADYVDGVAGTNYPVEYGVWVERLSRGVGGGGDDKGKTMVEEEEYEIGERLVIEDVDVAESSSSRN